MPEDPHVDIGRLRWRVQLYDLVQMAEEAGPGIDETLEGVVTLYADIQQVGANTFFEGKQLDTPFTHRIFVRWHDVLPMTKALVRVFTYPNGTLRREVFRLHRLKELGGRKRFTLLECELYETQQRDGGL